MHVLLNLLLSTIPVAFSQQYNSVCEGLCSLGMYGHGDYAATEASELL